MTQSDTVCVGVLGAGAVAQIMHLPILTEREDVVVAALADPSEPKARALAGRFGIAGVMSDDEVLAAEHVQAVVIAAPGHRHGTLSIAALEAGKHVLVERPIALTAARTQAVLEAAEASGKTVMVAMNHRFRPDVGALTAFVAGGDLGRVYSVRASSLVRYTGRRSAWRKTADEPGGGAVMDLGVQIIDLSMGLLGFPRIERVSAVFEDGQGGEDVESAATIMMTSEDGVAFSIEANWNLYADADRHYARVMGTEGSAQLPPLEVHKVFGGRPMDITPRQPKPRGGENPFTNAYRRLLDQWVRTIQGTCDWTPPVEQVGLMSVLEAIYRSAEEGREVRVEGA